MSNNSRRKLRTRNRNNRRRLAIEPLEDEDCWLATRSCLSIRRFGMGTLYRAQS
jgi:hypothetical protein